jgi:hypothetical protein
VQGESVNLKFADTQCSEGLVPCSYAAYFGPNAPASQENNSVQTRPGKSWQVILRLYSPLQPWFDKTLKPGDIELAQ